MMNSPSLTVKTHFFLFYRELANLPFLCQSMLIWTNYLKHILFFHCKSDLFPSFFQFRMKKKDIWSISSGIFNAKYWYSRLKRKRNGAVKIIIKNVWSHVYCLRLTWYVLVFIAITALTGTIKTITPTPANTDGPRVYTLNVNIYL